jgi:hypothetical protein
MCHIHQNENKIVLRHQYNIFKHYVCTYCQKTKTKTTKNKILKTKLVHVSGQLASCVNYKNTAKIKDIWEIKIKIFLWYNGPFKMQICKDAMQHIHFVCSTFAKI